MIWFAMAVDTALYGLLGYIIVRLGKRHLPPPWNEADFTVPVVLAIGCLITLTTFPHWAVFPR
jgi:hypothetical protein